MASYLISICIVLAMSSVEMGGGSALASTLPLSVNASLEPPITVGPQSVAPRRNADPVLLDVTEARGEVQQSLNHLAEILNQVIDERKMRRLSLQKLEAIEDRLKEDASLESPDDAVLLEVTYTRGHVQQSLNHLTVILNQVLAERRSRRQSLRELEAIEARLRDGPSCTGNPCQNGGTCSEKSTGYSCLCAPGYSGSICQIDTDECSSNPCRNGSVCIDGINSYQCACAMGYTGVHCENDMDECASNPCNNGGPCIDDINSYQCACVAGYTGAHCEISMDECSSRPCHNGGSCIHGNNSYQCVCAVGYSGVDCEINRDECSSNPCHNGGSCVDGNNIYQCACIVGYTGVHCEIKLRDCSDLKLARPGSVSGLYTIYPNATWSARVYCDMDTDRGGWTVFQRRQNGLVNFYRTWEDYAAGFGDLDGEVWLGNRLLHALTRRRNYRLRVDLADWDNNTRVAEYDLFVVSSEQDKFRLTVGTYSGTAGDPLSQSSGMQFSTRDQDNDVHSSAHCAQVRRGAWWYRSCSQSNLNGGYYPAGPYTAAQSQTGDADGVWWAYWKGEWYSLKTTRMMIRPAP